MSRNLQTIAQFAGKPFTQSQLRWWIFNAATNGLNDSGAIVRLQRRIYIDVDRFDEWIDRQNQTGAHPQPRGTAQAAA